MAADDFFKRKGLLPSRVSGTLKLEDPDLLDRPTTSELFTRKTQPPQESSPEEHAKQTMEEADVHERETSVGTPPELAAVTPPAASQASDPPLRSVAPPSQSLSIPPFELDDDDALGFVDAHARDTYLPPEPGPEAPVEAEALPQDLTPGTSLSDLYAVHDFTGALEEAQRRLSQEPEDPVAQRYADLCREALTKMYLAKLGSTERRMLVEIAADQIRWLSMDHRAGFLLSLVDGHSNIEDIIDISGMPRFDALRIIVELLDRKVVSLTD